MTCYSHQAWSPAAILCSRSLNLPPGLVSNCEQQVEALFSPAFMCQYQRQPSQPWIVQADGFVVKSTSVLQPWHPSLVTRRSPLTARRRPARQSGGMSDLCLRV